MDLPRRVVGGGVGGSEGSEGDEERRYQDRHTRVKSYQGDRGRWRRTESRPTPNELMVNQGRVRPGRGGKDEDGKEKECGED